MGYAIGAFALVCLLSALNGFERVIFNVYDTYYPDLKITPISGKVFEADSVQMLRITKLPTVKAAAYVLEENAVIQNGDNQVVGVVKGVDAAFLKVVKTDSLIVAGAPGFRDVGGAKIWMAEGLFYKLNLGSDNRVVSLMAPGRESSQVSQIDMMEEQARVAAIIRPGDENDQKLVITDIQLARDLFERDREASGIEIKLKNAALIAQAKNEIAKVMGPRFQIRDRKQQNQAIYKMFNTEKWVAFALMTFVLLIISFNLVGSLSMLVMEKKRDIKLLQAVGMRSEKIKQLFFTEGVFVSFIGTVLGILFGILMVYMQAHYGLIKTNSTFVSAYPVELRMADVLLILGMGAILGVSGAMYPAWKSSIKE